MAHCQFPHKESLRLLVSNGLGRSLAVKSVGPVTERSLVWILEPTRGKISVPLSKALNPNCSYKSFWIRVSAKCLKCNDPYTPALCLLWWSMCEKPHVAKVFLRSSGKSTYTQPCEVPKDYLLSQVWCNFLLCARIKRVIVTANA